MNDVKKYSYMENVLLKINQKFISLDGNEKKLNNAILRKLLDVVISKMRRQNPLFDKMFQKIFYGGSYYDGLKIGNPEEYDLDIILDLPKLLEVQLDSKKPGYVYVYAKEFEKFRKSAEALKYPRIENFMCEDKYFSTKKVRSWIEGLLTKVLKEFDQNEIIVEVDNQPLKVHIVNFSKSGPAFTLKVETLVSDRVIKMDIDLVTCFNMMSDKWPQGYIENPIPTKNTFFVVPKKPPSSVVNGDLEEEEKFWRLSFQEQERQLLKGRDYKALKPSVKLIKQLRNYQNQKAIASYFIKTIYLWELKDQKQEFWANNSLSFVFITMLRKYAECLMKGEIRYYWNPKFNLVGHVSSVTLTDFGKSVSNILNNIELSSHDPFVVAFHLLPRNSVEDLKKEVDIGKKHLKKQQIGAAIQKISTSKPPQKLAFDPTNEEHIQAVLRDPLFLKSVIEVYQTKIATNSINTSAIEYETPKFCVAPCANLICLDSDDEDSNPSSSTDDSLGESKFSFTFDAQTSLSKQEVGKTNNSNSKQEAEKIIKNPVIDSSVEDSACECKHSFHCQIQHRVLNEKLEKIGENVENVTRMLNEFRNSQSKYKNDKKKTSQLETLVYCPLLNPNDKNSLDPQSVPSSASEVSDDNAQNYSFSDLSQLGINFTKGNSLEEC